MGIKDKKFWEKLFKVGERIGVLNATMRTWKSRGFVPTSYHFKLLQAAPKISVKLSIDELNERRTKRRKAA